MRTRHARILERLEFSPRNRPPIPQRLFHVGKVRMVSDLNSAQTIQSLSGHHVMIWGRLFVYKDIAVRVGFYLHFAVISPPVLKAGTVGMMTAALMLKRPHIIAY